MHADAVLPPRHRARQHPAARRAAPLLLDFGAARRVIGDMTQAITVDPQARLCADRAVRRRRDDGAGRVDRPLRARLRRLLRDHRQDADVVGRAADGRPARAARGRGRGPLQRRASCARSTPRSRCAPATGRRPSASSAPCSTPTCRRSPRTTRATAAGCRTRPSPARWRLRRRRRRSARPPAFAAVVATTVAATVPDTAPAPSVEPSAWREPSAWSASQTSIELPTLEPAASVERAADSDGSASPATVGARRNPAATLADRYRHRRGDRDRRALRLAPAARPGAGRRQRRALVDRDAGGRPPSLRRRRRRRRPSRRPAPPRPSRRRPRHRADATGAVDSPTPASPAPSAAPALVERTPIERSQRSRHRPATAAKIDPPADAAPAPPTAAPVERATVDGDAAQAPRPRRRVRTTASRVAGASTSARSNAAAPKPTEPRTPTVSARCSDILQKASLEPLTATEAAYLKRECR